MSSLKELTQDTTDRQDSKKLAHLKTYTFFVFYQPSQGFVSSTLHKMCLKLKDDKPGGLSESKSFEQERQVQMFFYNLEEQGERMRGLLDLKLARQQSKSKIVGYCTEERLLDLLAIASKMAIDTFHIPIILTQTDPTSDLAIFSGWNEAETGPFSEMNINKIEVLSRKWIQSAPQKVDLWKVTLKLKEDGRLEKLEGLEFKTVETPDLKFQQLFISHISLGYHVKLCKKYQQRRSAPEKRKTNSLIYGWQSFKNFCCLGSSNMKAATGVVNISFIDDRGEEHEILKHLREYDGSEESQLEASRIVKSDRGIYSLLVANIDRFHGTKLQNLNCKPGDGRIEVILFEGVKKWRKIGSVSGQVLLRFESECIQLQMGESVYRCWGARELRIGQSGRAKVAISREMLSC